jgi:hypothetical protein
MLRSACALRFILRVWIALWLLLAVLFQAYATDIFKNQPVTLTTGGVLNPATAGDAFKALLLVLSGLTLLVVVVFPTTGLQHCIQTGSCVAYYYSDPNIVYEIQADGSLAQTSIGDQANFTNTTAGSTTTGLSQCTRYQPHWLALVLLAIYVLLI